MKLYIIVVYIALAYGRSIPDYIPQCNRSDPDLAKCILEGVEAIRPRLKTGIPEINFPGLDPFTMENLSIDTSIAVGKVKAIARNITAYGGGDFKIKDLKVDVDGKYTITAKLVLPRLDVTAYYNTRGSRALFIVPINLSAKFKGSFSNVEVMVNCVAAPVMVNDVEYLHLDTLTTKVTIGKAELDINADNSESVRAVARSLPSPQFYLRVLNPVIDEMSSSIAYRHINKILSVVPLNDVLVSDKKGV